MSINRSLLVRGPGIINFGGGTFYTKTDINCPLAPNWSPVTTSAYGRIDDFLKDRVYKVGMRLWGAWENLAIIFPSYALNPLPGTSIFGQNNTNLTVLGRNGDQVQYLNAQITRLANLYLGVDQDLFSADVEFTIVLGNSAPNVLHNPEDANAYYTVSTGNAYADNAFSKANYKKVRFNGTWGANAGFQSFVAQKGFQLAWELDCRPLMSDGYGTVDFTIGENALIGTCKGISIGPSYAQIESQIAAQGEQLGSLLSNLAADLTLTGNGGEPVITLKSAAITSHGYVFGIEPLRVAEASWKTTRGFANGAPNVSALVA